MPTYSYRCGSCGHEFSTILRMTQINEPEQKPCEECGEENIKNVICTPRISYSTNPGMTVSDNFTSRLREIKQSKGEGCTIETKN